MAQTLISTYVNMAKLPNIDEIPIGTQLTIGDLHANAIKLLYMLVRHGIVAIEEKNYNRIVEIYRTMVVDLTKSIINEFNALIDELQITNSSTIIRLIGDELADRGENDYFTLKILGKLSREKVPVEILLSNHGIEFIEFYELEQYFSSRLGIFARSMYQFHFLIDEGIITKSDVFELINQGYKPNLKTASYTLDKENNTITIYSHAPIYLKLIESLAEKMAVNYEDDTITMLAQTINKINSAFSKFVHANKINTLYDKNSIAEDEEKQEDCPIEFLTWNRSYSKLVRKEDYKGYKIIYVHGHDSSVPTEGNVYNLDNSLGKAPGDFTGEYTVLLTSNESQLDLSSEKIDEFNQELEFTTQKTNQLSLAQIARRSSIAFFQSKNTLVSYLEKTANGNAGLYLG